MDVSVLTPSIVTKSPMKPANASSSWELFGYSLRFVLAAVGILYLIGAWFGCERGFPAILAVASLCYSPAYFLGFGPAFVRHPAFRTIASVIIFFVYLGTWTTIERITARDGYQVTRYERFGRVYYIHIYKDASSLSGYYSPSGSQHGPWKSWSLQDGTETIFFWYGERVSEGEFHLRNR